MYSRKILRRLLASLCFILIFLNGCASYEVTQKADRKLIPLEPASTEIVWLKGNPESLIVKQERGHGVLQPVFSKDERRELAVIRQQVFVELAGNLAPKLKSSLAPYIQKQGKGKQVLNLELNRVLIDADGTRDITITATLSEPPFDMEYWSRKIKIFAPRYSTNDVISTHAADAVVAQLRSSALIK